MARYLRDAHQDALLWHASAPSERLVCTGAGELVVPTRHEVPTGCTSVTRADGYRRSVPTGSLARSRPQQPSLPSKTDHDPGRRLAGSLTRGEHHPTLRTHPIGARRLPIDQQRMGVGPGWHAGVQRTRGGRRPTTTSTTTTKR